MEDQMWWWWKNILLIRIFGQTKELNWLNLDMVLQECLFLLIGLIICQEDAMESNNFFNVNPANGAANVGYLFNHLLLSIFKV